MTIATITYGLPTPSPSQRPIASVRPEVSADAGANWSGLPLVAVGDTPEVVIADIPAGDWLVKLTVIDNADVESGGLDTPFAVPFDAPGEVVNVTVTLS